MTPVNDRTRRDCTVGDEREDFLFLEIEEDDNEIASSTATSNTENKLVAVHASSEIDAYSGYRQFQTFADISLEQLTRYVLGHGKTKDGSMRNSPLLLSQEQVMKLRSIMRFATEYHNALLVRSAQCDSRVTDATPALVQFLETSDTCFGAICQILSGDSSFLDSSTHFQAFVEAWHRLKSLEEAVKQEICVGRLQCEGLSLLEQAVSAVVGQMSDFHDLALER